VGARKGIQPVNKLDLGLFDGDDLTGALHVLQLQSSPPLPLSLTVIKPANPVHLEKWLLKLRERGKQVDQN